MDKKGFTLIELVATIAIMLLITVIAVPSVLSILDKSAEDEYNTYVKTFEKTAKNYWNEKGYPVNLGGNCYQLKLETILDDEVPNNPKTNEKFSGVIEVKTKNNKIKFTYKDSSKCGTNFNFANSEDDDTDDQITMTSMDDILKELNIDVPDIVKDLIARGNILHISNKNGTSKKSGLYIDEDDFGTTFYMYGTNNDIEGDTPLKNYVTFAGKTWKIMRVNGDDTLRLVLDDTIYLNPTISVGTRTKSYDDIIASDENIKNKIKEIGQYNIAFGGTNFSSIYNPDYDIYKALNNWYDVEIDENNKDHVIQDDLNDTKHFCSERTRYSRWYYGDTYRDYDYSDYNDAARTNYKCDNSCSSNAKDNGYSEWKCIIGENNFINPVGMLSKIDVEYGGLIDNKSNSFLYSTSNYLLNTLSTAFSGWECSYTVNYNTSSSKTYSWCTKQVNISPNGEIINQKYSNLDSYYVGEGNILTKKMFSVDGNDNDVTDKSTREMYVENDNGAYTRLLDKYKYYPKSEVRYNQYGYEPQENESAEYIQINNNVKYTPKGYIYRSSECKATSQYPTSIYSGDNYIKYGSEYIEIENDEYDENYNKVNKNVSGMYYREKYNNKYYKKSNYSIYYRVESMYSNVKDTYTTDISRYKYTDYENECYSIISGGSFIYKNGAYYKVKNHGDYFAVGNYAPEYEKINNKFYSIGTGYVYDYRPLKLTYENMGVRPVINLKDNVRIKDGNGTKDNPFTLEFGE